MSSSSADLTFLLDCCATLWTIWFVRDTAPADGTLSKQCRPTSLAKLLVTSNGLSTDRAFVDLVIWTGFFLTPFIVLWFWLGLWSQDSSSREQVSVFRSYLKIRWGTISRRQSSAGSVSPFSKSQASLTWSSSGKNSGYPNFRPMSSASEAVDPSSSPTSSSDRNCS